MYCDELTDKINSYEFDIFYKKIVKVQIRNKLFDCWSLMFYPLLFIFGFKIYMDITTEKIDQITLLSLIFIVIILVGIFITF